MRIHYAVLALLAVFHTSGAMAQAGPTFTTGVVRDERSGQPIAGAVVSAVSAAGVSLRQTLTDRAGVFRLETDTLARRLVVRRIGFLPWEGAIADGARNGTALDIHLQPIPATLAPVTATAVKCRETRGAGQALALFQQARFALLATTVAPDVATAHMAVARYHQRGTDDHDMLQTLSIINGTSNQAFAATLTPVDMVDYGFVSGGRGGRTFHGLDPELLLSDEFAATHCFDVASGSGDRRGQIGIVFTPTPDRTRMIDVSGTIWLDQSPLALRALEFRYENVAAADRKAGAGGTFTFRTAANGVVLIDSWQLRILSGAMASMLVPQMADIMNGDPDAAAPPPAGAAARNVPVIQVEGGSILSAVWTDNTEVRRPLDVIEGIVHERGTGHPLAGIAIQLANTPYHTVTGEDGSFHLSGVYPGSYTLAAVDSAWEPFELGRPASARVEARDNQPAAVKLDLEDRTVAVQRLCDLTGSSTGPAMLVGRVVDPAGQTTAVKVGADAYDDGGRIVGEHVVPGVSGGRFWICGVYPGKVKITATDPAQHAATTTVTLTRSDITRVTLTVGTPPR